jgi:branched-chain amino acid transport system ATP-binding protein
MLEIVGLEAGYGDQSVLFDVSLNVATGEAVTIVGSNGAGKTTLFRTIVGLLPAATGRIDFADTTLCHRSATQRSRTPTHRVSRLGLGYVPAERHLFPSMSVEENLKIGAFPKRPDQQQLDFVFTVFPRLAERRSQAASTMSGGEQQMLAVARALMAKPRLLLLDEPTTGLAPIMAADAYQALSSLKDAGMTLLVAEQQVPLALELADRGYVLENGRIVLEGTSDELADNPDVQRAYLGVA